MNIGKEMEDILNRQICYEFKSAFAYLSLATALGKTHYSGFENWMRKQYEEELEHAKKRGAKIYAEIAGYGATGDAYHMTSPSPTGEAAAAGMKLAYEEAGLKPEDIN